MKAKLFIWPKLSDEDREQAEIQAARAGYTKKRFIRVGRIKCWLAS